MKKFLYAIIAAAVLMTGCNNLEPDGVSSSTTSSSESAVQDNEQSSDETDSSVSASEATEVPQSSSTNQAPSITSSDEHSTPSSSSSSTANNSSNTTSVTSSTSTTPESKPQSTASSASTTLESKSESTTNSALTTSDGNYQSAADSTSNITFTTTTGTSSDNSSVAEPPKSKEENDMRIMVTVNGRNFSAELYDSKTGRAFKEMLPLTLNMSELNGNEKYYYLPDRLPTNSSRPSGISTGDIMLYGSDCVVLFYESFSTSYSYTPIGRIDDPSGLAAALGSGDVQVTFT